MEQTSPPPQRPNMQEIKDFLGLLESDDAPTVREIALMKEVVALSKAKIEMMKMFNELKKEIVELNAALAELRDERDELQKQMELAEKDKLTALQVCEQREAEPQNLACWMKTALSVSLVTSIGVGGVMLLMMLV